MNFTIEVTMQVPSNVTGYPDYSDDADAKICHKQMEPVPMGYTVEYKCKERLIGRYVCLVKLMSKETVSICELEVYGQPFVQAQNPNDYKFTNKMAIGFGKNKRTFAEFHKYGRSLLNEFLYSGACQ